MKGLRVIGYLGCVGNELRRRSLHAKEMQVSASDARHVEGKNTAMCAANCELLSCGSSVFHRAPGMRLTTWRTGIAKKGGYHSALGSIRRFGFTTSTHRELCSISVIFGNGEQKYDHFEPRPETDVCGIASFDLLERNIISSSLFHD